MRGSHYPAPGDGVRDAHEAYDLGLACYRKKQWNKAAQHFASAQRQCKRGEVSLGLYRSYHGLCRVYDGDLGGLYLCRRAASMEVIHPRVFVNLALVELRLGHRERAHRAVQTGLDIDRTDPGLLRLRDTMGVRRTPFLPRLGRGHPLNRWVGRYTWQRL